MAEDAELCLGINAPDGRLSGAQEGFDAVERYADIPADDVIARAHIVGAGVPHRPQRLELGRRLRDHRILGTSSPSMRLAEKRSMA